MQIRQKIFTPADSITAEIFLRFFGVVILLQVSSYIKADFIEQGILTPKFLFTYDFFHWIKPLSPGLMNLLFPLLFISGVLLILNKLRKIALLTFLLVFSYLFLLEKSYYNNHFYLFMLIAFLFLFFNPKKNIPENKSVIPYWFLLLLQIQIVIVYFYGGLAKLNSDWLFDMQPMKALLETSEKKSALPFLNKQDFTLYFLNYGGLIFDLCIGILLWIKKTRKIAIILCLLFHSFNFLLFNFGAGGDIGIFPAMMMASCILFADPEWVRNKLSFLIPSLKKEPGKKKKLPEQQSLNFQKNSNAAFVFVSFYLVIQLLLPLRHWLYPGNTSWTGEGSRFAWRMKVHVKNSEIKYYFQLSPADSTKPVNDGMLINTMQKYMMAEEPVMLLQFANYLGNDLKKSGYNNPVIKVSAKVSLNERPAQFVVDSTQNLLELKHNIFGYDDWILPLK